MRIFRRLPRWVLPLAFFLAAYFAIDVVGFAARHMLHYWFRGVNPAFLEPHEHRLEVDLRLAVLKVHEVVLLVASVVYGFRRSVANHPAHMPEYRKWLRTTPWQPGMPLPLGPATLQWWDGLVVAGGVALNYFTGFVPWSVLFLPGCIAYAVGGLMTATGQSRHAYAVGLGLSLIVWFVPHYAVMSAIAVPIMLIAHDGLRRSLYHFPWDKPEEDSYKEPWPLPIFKDVKPLVPGTKAIATVVMVTSWLGALALQSRIKPDIATLITIIFCFIASLVRWGIYCGSYRPPLTLRARIVFFRPILPGYDQALVAPFLGFILSIALPLQLYFSRVPAPAIAVTSIGAILMLLQVGGPKLRVWQLTGYHVPPSPVAKQRLSKA